MTYPHRDPGPIYDEVRERFVLFHCPRCLANGVAREGDPLTNVHAGGCSDELVVRPAGSTNHKERS